ncbi:NAD-dependent malic enzyme [Numidum massiliense]|uniref:NAD-dependent malic enzyme n=1 Tax=Numidum massiliense TaxID=1522315 RepID=UPI0006D5659A|nr:NAD-dependent malic enzyme [Numidum massiliense]
MRTQANLSIILRLEMDKNKVSFGQLATAISEAEGDIVAIDVIHQSRESTVRDVTVNLPDKNSERIVNAVQQLDGIELINVSDRTFLMHIGGKIETKPKMPIKNREDLSHVYTPGVARVCMAIHEDENKAYSLTMKRNTVAVVSDGTAVLGLGDVGPRAAMPVMEGKAVLFKQFAKIDAVPICLDTTDTEEIIRTVKAIAPAFGGINLEDISSPRCFEIEQRLKEELDIPVFHDDQHGTAVVLLAGLLNALKIVGKAIETAKIVVTGIGAAGVACTKMLLSAGAKNVICVDRAGALVASEQYDNPMWQWCAAHTNAAQVTGSLSEVIEGADVFIGISGPGVLKVEDVKKMADDAIVFALANPAPEILPDEAEPYVRVMATGRSDYPNQINNVLCFPGIFRGALDCRATTINEEMKLAAAQAIASIVGDDELGEHYITPSVFNKKVAGRIREAVIRAAIDTDVARRIPREFR